MINEIFGKWTVLREMKISKPGKHYECICECGNLRIIPGTTLRAKRSKQCSDCQYFELYNPEKEIGKKYGKWTIISFVDIHRKLMRFETICECGFTSLHLAAELRSKKTRQCINCHNKENSRNNIKHGMHNTSTYKIWHAMLQRCNNKNSTSYRYYGSRGISVCERWSNFDNFLQDMGIRPDNMDLDRIDNDGNYEPKNCRWITHKENCNNRKKRYK